MFRDLPFRPDSQDLACKPQFKKLQWPLFALARTYEQLRAGQYHGVNSKSSSTDKQIINAVTV